jgi:hypothetical protein
MDDVCLRCDNHKALILYTMKHPCSTTLAQHHTTFDLEIKANIERMSTINQIVDNDRIVTTGEKSKHLIDLQGNYEQDDEEDYNHRHVCYMEHHHDVNGVDDEFLQELFDIADHEDEGSALNVPKKNISIASFQTYAAELYGSDETLHSISSYDEDEDDDDDDDEDFQVNFLPECNKRKEVSILMKKKNKKQRVGSLDESSSCSDEDSHTNHLISPCPSPCSSTRAIVQLESNNESITLMDPLFCLPSSSSYTTDTHFMEDFDELASIDPLSSQLYYLPTLTDLHSDAPSSVTLHDEPHTIQLEEDKTNLPSSAFHHHNHPETSQPELQAPCSSMDGFVNAYLVVDPNTNMVYFPKQVIAYRHQNQLDNNDVVIETTTFGPFLLPTFNTSVVKEFTQNVVVPYQQHQQENINDEK